MLNLRQFSERHLYVARDGRTVFFPKGPSGPGYLVPDAETYTRIERLLNVFAIVASVLCFGVIDLAVKWDPEHRLWWLASLALLPFLYFKLREWAAESLPPLTDPSLQEEAIDRSLRDETMASLRAHLAVGVALFVGGAAWLLTSGEARWQAVAMVAGGLIATFADLQRLREKRESEARRNRRVQAWRTADY